jgi:hypothetical protein
MKIARDLEIRQSHGSSTDASIALTYVGLGDNDQTMIRLNKAYQARFNPSILMRPVFDPLTTDPRFQDLPPGSAFQAATRSSADSTQTGHPSRQNAGSYCVQVLDAVPNA